MPRANVPSRRADYAPTIHMQQAQNLQDSGVMGGIWPNGKAKKKDRQQINTLCDPPGLTLE